jgi:hypothetical protein
VELERHRLFLGRLFTIMRSDDAQLAQRMMLKIRNTTQLDEIADLAENITKSEPDLHQKIGYIGFPNNHPPAAATIFLGTSSSSGTRADYRLRPDYLINPPVTVNALPWTKIASSEVVSHLFSLYFTWEQPLFQFIDKTCFLAAFHSGDLSHRFCSKVLVHALLSHASVSHQHFRNFLVLIMIAHFSTERM